MRTVVYDNSGAIKFVASGAPSENFCLNGESYLTETGTSVMPKTHYVDLTVNPPAIKTRPTSPVVVNKTTIKADGSDTAIFSNIPNGTVCTHDGETYTVTDGVIEFTTTHDGDYDFVFELFPYITASFTITAEEPTS